ncbi:LPXTG cell wall anchor domain-containing protein [Macrococcoides caseolyticum]|uniref:LPXTG cell wall anchor domain-containing protein n=1 Tax=Macrococcoides caseolyticum TaxID=69966 RepID=UPI001C5E8A53|nr:LPXTG cell wall anchor domain-containing protein [Macrococcus caseolyticus]QYA39811.1 LPXTG cell wall anchor domain-containing protein [Macrococcus caseolyticus]
MYKFKVKAVAALVCMLGLSTQNATLSEAADNSVTAEQPSSEQVESAKAKSSLKSTEDKSPESPVIEIVSTEIIKEDETTEMPTTEAPTTEIPSKEQTPTTELPSVEVDQPTERPTTEVPTTEVPTTEVPTTEHPAPAFPSHDDADSTPPKYDVNDYSAGIVPPSPGTIDIPELPDTPVSQVELSDSESEYSSLEEDDDLLGIKPGKFKPTDGEAYYAVLDKQVCDLVTREIGKSKKNHQDKDSKTTSKQKQKEKKHSELPDTGENVFMYVLASVSLLLSGLILLRKS